MPSTHPTKSLGLLLLGWGAALLIFFPIFWMFLTSLKTEKEAAAGHAVWFFWPTLQNYANVFSQSDYSHYAWNSTLVSLGGTLLAMAISIPAAYSLAFHFSRRSPSLLAWMLSTKMMPPVSALIPLYLMLAHLKLLDSVVALTGIYALMNLPITVWLTYSYFREIPVEILEAGRIDGMTAWQEIRYLLLQMSLPGLASTALLSVILCWNEAFWSLNLTAAKAGPVALFIATYSSPEGLFLAKLSAASTLAIAPILIFGVLAQRQLVRGLTFGAVK
jgi:sorbitol/mannitol transport system permease protein